MKNFFELSDLEIYNLSPEQIETYKKIALAEAGIKFPVEPVKPVLEPEPAPNMVVYTIACATFRLAFARKCDAEDVLEALNSCSTAGLLDGYGVPCFKPGYGKTFDGQKNMLAVEPIEAYSEDAYKAYREIRNRNTDSERVFDEACKEYSKRLDEASKVLDPIDARLLEARHTIGHRIMLTNMFAFEYLPIAENDTEIAMRFLKKAYTVKDEDEAYIREHYAELLAQ